MTRREIRSQVRSFLTKLNSDTSELTAYSAWTDAEINRLIDESSKIFCEETRILETSETIAIVAGVGTITSNPVKVKRVEISGQPIGWVYKNEYDEDLPAID